MQMYCRQAATEAERERALVSEHETTGLGGPGWGWGGRVESADSSL